MHDNRFLKNYKKWFKKHNYNDLRDCAYITPQGGRNRWRDDELAELRNHPKQRYVERVGKNSRYPAKLFRSAFTPSLDQLFQHFVQHGDSTIFVANSTSDVLLMLADIDNKQGTGDVERAASHLAATYMDDQCFVEVSTRGRGRHVYFLLDTTVEGADWNDRSDVWDAIKSLTERIKADPVFGDCGVKFDGFYGLPSCWTRSDGRWSLVKRGNLLKLPYVANGDSDMLRLARLRPLKIVEAAEYSSFKGRDVPSQPDDSGASDRTGEDIQLPTTTTKGYIRVTTRFQPKMAHCDPSAITCAFAKKKACVDWLLQQTNGSATEADCLAEYNANWHPTGMDAKDISRRQRIMASVHRERLLTFRPSCSRHLHSFRRNEYLTTVADLVPASAFQWKRRERLDHQRLSDFLSIKIQDAFFDKTDYFAATSRDATISNSRTLKAKGMIDWTLTSHTYKRLLQIATDYMLLEVVQEARRPTIDSRSGQRLAKGSGAVVAPGEAFPALREEWQKLYSDWQRQNVYMAA